MDKHHYQNPGKVFVGSNKLLTLQAQIIYKIFIYFLDLLRLNWGELLCYLYDVSSAEQFLFMSVMLI